MKKALSLVLSLVMLLCCGVCLAEPEAPVAEVPTSGGDLTRLIVPQTVYAYDEPIMISAIGEGKDWVGIYSPELEGGSMYWTYVTDVGSGVEFDMRKIEQGNIPYAQLPAGTYTLRLLPNDSTDINLSVAWVDITVLPEGVAGGDLALLDVPKLEYAYGEPIMISAIGEGKDWVGIYSPELEGGSMYWTYVTEVGSGVEFDMANVAHGNVEKAVLAPGSYTIRLIPNDNTDVNLSLAWVTITVLPE